MLHLLSKKNVPADAVLANWGCGVHFSSTDEWLPLTEWSDRLEKYNINLYGLTIHLPFFFSLSRKNMEGEMKFYCKWCTFIVKYQANEYWSDRR